MFEWGWPWLFLLLPLPWLVLRWWPAADEQGAALHLPYDDVLDPAVVAGSARRVFTGLGLAWLIWALLVTAARGRNGSASRPTCRAAAARCCSRSTSPAA